MKKTLAGGAAGILAITALTLGITQGTASASTGSCSLPGGGKATADIAYDNYGGSISVDAVAWTTTKSVEKIEVFGNLRSNGKKVTYFSKGKVGGKNNIPRKAGYQVTASHDVSSVKIRFWVDSRYCTVTKK